MLNPLPIVVVFVVSSTYHILSYPSCTMIVVFFCRLHVFYIVTVAQLDNNNSISIIFPNIISNEVPMISN